MKLFHRTTELSGVHVLSPHPYSMRHGGASHDALTAHRSLAAIKRHGRWRSDASVVRYSKHARVLHEAAKLPDVVRQYALAVEKNLVKILAKQLPAPRPPRLRPRLALPKARGKLAGGLRR